ncbi:hypothetical protein H6768_03330 [Candidatus Peribacteria bacterium]|nr:hypothetical protein [Candidatus Peribacteria bacterium]
MNNNKEKPINPEEQPDKGSSENLNEKKFQQEKKELLKGFKKEKDFLMHEIEQEQISRDNAEAQEFMRQADFPHNNPEHNESSQYESLKQLFQEIPTDHVDYPFFRKYFPSFIRVAESTRLGENVPAEVVFLALGIAQSLTSLLKLTGHLVVDAGRLIFQPRSSIQEAREFMK